MLCKLALHRRGCVGMRLTSHKQVYLVNILPYIPTMWVPDMHVHQNLNPLINYTLSFNFGIYQICARFTSIPLTYLVVTSSASLSSFISCRTVATCFQEGLGWRLTYSSTTAAIPWISSPSTPINLLLKICSRKPRLWPRFSQQCSTSFTISMRLSVLRVGSAGWGDNMGDMMYMSSLFNKDQPWLLFHEPVSSGRVRFMSSNPNTSKHNAHMGCVHWPGLKNNHV